MLPNRSRIRIGAIALLSLLTLARVASTHRIFSATADEPVHIASGYEWITRGAYVFDPEHPPLARALFGLGLRASGVVSPPPEDWRTLQPTWKAAARGMDLLWQNGEYAHNLANARRGNLLFLLLALITIAAWAWHAYGPGVALLATALFATLPPVLAHSGLATTDMAVAATLPLALFTLERWRGARGPRVPRSSSGSSGASELLAATATPRNPEEPRGTPRNPRNPVLMGLAIGAGLGSKLSFLLFFAVGAIVMIALAWLSPEEPRGTPRNPRNAMRSAWLAVAVATLVVWSLYCFEWRTMEAASAQMPELVGKTFGAPGAWLARNVPLPAPTFAVGVMWTKVHSERGHSAFLLGQRGDRGWWYYFPIALGLKTPLPFLLLFFYGAIRSLRDGPLHFVLIPIALLISVLPVSLNIGVRHVLVVYPFMAIAAAFGARELWRSRNTIARGAVVLLVAWQAIGTSLAHPDYLPWFNELAGAHPEMLLGDSNLDWGQDLLRLSAVAREEKIEQLSILIFGPAGFDRVPLPPHQPLAPGVPTQGWIAVSETALQLSDPADTAWLRRYRPVRRVGKSIRLYFIQ
jgi:4-amino-4-deoxy-L-arabinose transferase-like glycosyltransferase